MIVGNIQMEIASLWVQIWGALFDMISPQVVKEVGSGLGKVKEVEWKRRKDDINFFMRVRVALPISNPLSKGGFIAGSDGERSWVSFRYKRLPMFCHSCGILGHNLKHCAAHYAAKKNGGSMEYQYGDFLRAIGGRAKASVSQHTSPKSNIEEGIGSGLVQSSVLMVQQWMTAEAAREVGQENPKSANEDDSMNPRIDMKIMYADRVDYAGHANMKDGNSMVVRSSLEITQSLNDNAELNKGLGEKLSFLKTDE